jgi:predicted Zn-dependent protease
VDLRPANPLNEPRVLPGGYVFVPLALLQTAKDEAEFAGMLAQAIARESLLEQQATNSGGTPLIF